MKKNGFGTVGVIAIIAVIVLVGVSAWVVWKRQNNNETDPQTDTSQPANSTDNTETNNQTHEGTNDLTENPYKQFKGAVKLPNGETTTLSFEYDESWSFKEDSGYAIFLKAGEEVEVEVSYSAGASAPGGATRVNFSGKEYKRFQWLQQPGLSVIRYFLITESGLEADSDKIQHISIEGSSERAAEADKKIGILLSTLMY